jgi:hypothetical protein
MLNTSKAFQKLESKHISFFIRTLSDDQHCEITPGARSVPGGSLANRVAAWSFPIYYICMMFAIVCCFTVSHETIRNLAFGSTPFEVPDSLGFRSHGHEKQPTFFYYQRILNQTAARG